MSGEIQVESDTSPKVSASKRFRVYGHRKTTNNPNLKLAFNFNSEVEQTKGGLTSEHSARDSLLESDDMQEQLPKFQDNAHRPFVRRSRSTNKRGSAPGPHLKNNLIYTPQKAEILNLGKIRSMMKQTHKVDILGSRQESRADSVRGHEDEQGREFKLNAQPKSQQQSRRKRQPVS